MTAWRARAGLLVALGLVASGAVALMSGTAAAGSTTPSLECVYHDTGTGQYNALWGYTNWYFFPDYEPIGGNNSFWPYPSNRGQPTTFQTGNHDNVFVTTWNGSGGLTWYLDGYSATAYTWSTPCSQNPVPATGDLAWYVLPGAMLAVGLAGLWIWCRRFGLALSIATRRSRTSRTSR
ncbi:MAG TPA: hypothetical protein VFC99_18390 [Acidimicrobiia bacterium]|nr:hypothetical protein [Acidimicrobiia bacterium]